MNDDVCDAVEQDNWDTVLGNVEKKKSTQSIIQSAICIRKHWWRRRELVVCVPHLGADRVRHC